MTLPSQSAEIFDALGNPIRREILALLQQQPQAVRALAEQLPVSRPAVSRHLSILQDAQLVCVHAQGTSNIYSIEPQGFEAASSWLAAFWDNALMRFKLLAENTTEASNMSTKTQTKTDEGS